MSSRRCRNDICLKTTQWCAWVWNRNNPRVEYNRRILYSSWVGDLFNLRIIRTGKCEILYQRQQGQILKQSNEEYIPLSNA